MTYPNIPGFPNPAAPAAPGAPQIPGFPAGPAPMQAPPPPLPQQQAYAPPAAPAAGNPLYPNWGQQPQSGGYAPPPAPPPGYGAPPPAAPQYPPAAYGQPPGYPPQGYGAPAQQQVQAAPADLAARLAAATQLGGGGYDPKLNEEESIGSHLLELAGSTYKNTQSKKNPGKVINGLEVKFNVKQSQAARFAAGGTVTRFYDTSMQGMHAQYDASALADLVAKVSGTPRPVSPGPNMPIVATPEYTAAMSDFINGAQRFVGKVLGCTIEPQANGKRGANGKLFVTEKWVVGA